MFRITQTTDVLAAGSVFMSSLCADQFESSTSPRATPRAFELLKIGLFKFPPSGQESGSNARPIITELPLLKTNFVFNQTLYTPLRERYAVMTPLNFFQRPF